MDQASSKDTGDGAESRKRTYDKMTGAAPKKKPADGDGQRSVFSSEPFKIFVGPQKEEVMIHKGLLERISEPLHKLMNGWMKEASDGVAYLNEADPTAFKELVSFAYTAAALNADMSVTMPYLRNRDNPACTGPSCEDDECLGVNYSFSLICNGLHHIWRLTDYLWKYLPIDPWIFSQIEHSNIAATPLFQFSGDYVRICGRKLANEKSHSNTKRSLVSSAKLYILADKYLVQGLQFVALHRLRIDLMKLRDTIFEEKEPESQGAREDFLELTRLAFGCDDPGTEPDGGSGSNISNWNVNELQLLVGYFIVCKRASLLSDQRFQKLYIRNGQIGWAVLEAMNAMTAPLDGIPEDED